MHSRLPILAYICSLALDVPCDHFHSLGMAVSMLVRVFHIFVVPVPGWVRIIDPVVVSCASASSDIGAFVSRTSSVFVRVPNWLSLWPLCAIIQPIAFFRADHLICFPGGLRPRVQPRLSSSYFCITSLTVQLKLSNNLRV